MARFDRGPPNTVLFLHADAAEIVLQRDEDDDTRRERSSRFSSIVCSLDRKGKERENGKLDGLNSFIRWRVSHTVEEKVVQHEHASICLCSSILAVGNFNLGFRLR